jgi:hypothetical protein
MKNIIYIIICLMFSESQVAAQQKNFIKIHVGDCVNCVSALSYIFKKDPKVALIIHGDYLSDSADVIMKFGLEPYCSQIIWDSKLYDSLSRETESELIQFYDKKEVNRSSLRKLHFIEFKTSPSKSINWSDLSNHLDFYDYKSYMVMDSYISKRKFVYYKDKSELSEIVIDSSWIRSIYVDFLKESEMYKHYLYESKILRSIAPKIMSVCPYDDSTLLAILKTYTAEIDGTDTSYSGLLSIIKVNRSKKNEVLYVDNKLTPFHYMHEKVLSHNKKIYIPVIWGIDSILQNKLEFENLALLKKEKSVYVFDRYMPTKLNDYLVDNKVYHNCNINLLDRGYYLMSLSNYLLNLETGEKVYIPFDDSLFHNIRLGPGLSGTKYNIWDFKYDTQKQMFYILYYDEDKFYVANFKRGAKTFERNETLYSFGCPFSKSIKGVCLSWDAKGIVYITKSDHLVKHATVAEMQVMAQNDKSTEGSK